MKRLSKYFFPSLIGLSALSVSASAAFYSVFGLSKLFAGASLEVIIMASTLEVSKLVIASLLHNYWNDLNKLLRVYLTSAVVVLILITSMGIYGFLSSAYQQTANQMSVVEKEIQFLKQKEDFYQSDVDRFDLELERISNNISTLSQARASQIQIRDTSVVGGVRNTISTTELRLAQQRIETEEQNRTDIQSKRTIASDSLRSIQTQILQAESNNEVAGELGPLKFVSNLTGISMDRIVNFFILVIVFVFDPLAVSLIIAANFAFKHTNKKVLEDSTWDDFVKEAGVSFNVDGEEDLFQTGEDWDAEDDKSDEELFENSQEDGLDDLEEEEDWVVVDDEPIEEEEETIEEKKEIITVVKVLQRSPGSRHLLLSNGKRIKVDKNDFDDNTMELKIKVD